MIDMGTRLTGSTGDRVVQLKITGITYQHTNMTALFLEDSTIYDVFLLIFLEFIRRKVEDVVIILLESSFPLFGINFHLQFKLEYLSPISPSSSSNTGVDL